MSKMEWKNLLSSDRERESTSKETPYRNCFDMDYERIIPSSSLRRLQDKTQVFPLQENDFTRTRLTHSLEVSSIARSIGAHVANILVEKKISDLEEQDLVKKKLPSLLAVCGLVHDLGNPPFGHYGEDVIQKWFNDNKTKLHFEKQVINDFGNFDGNAQTLRILSKLQYMKDVYGMNCCYGTLATLIKYPNDNKKLSHFKSENELFNKIVSSTGMKQGDKIYRHPATFLLEAADDIAYLFADLEDAVKKDSACLQEILNKIDEEKDKIFTKEFPYDEFKKSIDEFDLNRHAAMPKEDIISTKIMSLRVKFQAYCIDKVCDEFVNSYDEIMTGDYKMSLCESKNLANLIGDKGIIRKLCKKYAYQNSEVLKLEIIGKRVLITLLDSFVGAILCDDYEKPKEECGKFYNLISSNFKFIQHIDKNNNYNKNLDKYSRIQLVIDYISGMTDSYALNLHKTLLGTKLP